MESIILLLLLVGLLIAAVFLWKIACKAAMWGFIAMFVIFSLIGLVCGL